MDNFLDYLMGVGIMFVILSTIVEGWFVFGVGMGLIVGAWLIGRLTS